MSTMPLLLSRAFKLVQEQDKKIAREFSDKIQKLVDSPEYNEEIVIKTVDTILSRLPNKDKSLKNAIEVDLSRRFQDINWGFKSKL